MRYASKAPQSSEQVRRPCPESSRVLTVWMLASFVRFLARPIVTASRIQRLADVTCHVVKNALNTANNALNKAPESMHLPSAIPFRSGGII